MRTVSTFNDVEALAAAVALVRRFPDASPAHIEAETNLYSGNAVVVSDLANGRVPDGTHGEVVWWMWAACRILGVAAETEYRVTDRGKGKHADLVIFRDGSPYLVVEYKSRLVRERDIAAAIRQVNDYANLCGAPRALVVAPNVSQATWGAVLSICNLDDFVECVLPSQVEVPR